MRNFEKSFEFKINDKVHKVEAKLNSLKGIFTITIDGNPINIKNQHKFLIILDYNFEIDNTPCNITFSFCNKEFNLAINGTYLDTNKPYEPLVIPKFVNTLNYISIFFPCVLVGIMAGLKGAKLGVILSSFILVAIGLIASNIYTKFALSNKKSAIIPSFLAFSLIQILLIFFLM